MGEGSVADVLYRFLDKKAKQARSIKVAFRHNLEGLDLSSLLLPDGQKGRQHGAPLGWFVRANLTKIVLDVGGMDPWRVWGRESVKKTTSACTARLSVRLTGRIPP